MRLMDNRNVGVYHENVMENMRIKGTDDGRLIYVDVTPNLNILVVGGGLVEDINATIYGGLRVYNRDPATNSYTLF